MEKTLNKKGLWSRIKNHKELYFMLIPLAIYLIVFWLAPLYGIQIAFRNFRANDGFFGSEWVGLDHFIRFFESFYFERTVKNTLGINFYGLIVSFPLTIILALMFNEIGNKRFKNFTQIVSYAPTFLSAVVVGGMIISFFAASTGMVNSIVEFFGGERIDYLADPKYFWDIYVWTNVWQGIGFGTILYTAAMSSISEDLYEAATLDGAGKLRCMWHITLPGIQYVIIIMIILSLGNMMTLGFEKIYLLQNNLNLDASEVISTYVYKAGLIEGQFSYTTAIGLFNTVINLMLLSGANFISKKVRGISLY